MAEQLRRLGKVRKEDDVKKAIDSWEVSKGVCHAMATWKALALSYIGNENAITRGVERQSFLLKPEIISRARNFPPKRAPFRGLS